MNRLPRKFGNLFRTIFLTATAMTAFAANSLLCRMALGQHLIDAASFTSIRVISGALTLGLLVFVRTGKADLRPHWPGAGALFCYMVFCPGLACVLHLRV